MPAQAATSIDLSSLTRIASGKVRELYKVNDSTLLMAVTDRISAFDVVLSDGIPDKGAILCQISAFWFDLLGSKIPHLKHHLLSLNPPSAPQVISLAERAVLRGRCMQVRSVKVFPIEIIVRGYITGSAWIEYSKHGTVHGLPQQSGLQRCQEFPQGPIYTPSTKAPVGEKDENISPDQAKQIVGEDWAAKIEKLALEIYKIAHDFALAKGIVIADTKMEFGLDEATGELVLVDEVLTPDSSRFWPAPVRVGEDQPSFDKQGLRDYLADNGLKGKSGISLPQGVIEETTQKYREAFERLTGGTLDQALAALED